MDRVIDELVDDLIKGNWPRRPPTNQETGAHNARILQRGSNPSGELWYPRT